MEPTGTWKQYLHTEVSNKNTEYLMLACCVISGLSDSTIYNGVYRFLWNDVDMLFAVHRTELAS